MFIFVTISFLLGLCMGSFVNAWVWRTRTNRSVLKGRSICPECKHQLAWYDLIPIISYLSLKAKCRYCNKPINWQYLAVEAMTAILFVNLYLFIKPIVLFTWLELSILLIASIFLTAAFIYDAKYLELPEKFTLPTVVLGIIWLGLLAYQTNWSVLIPQLVSLAVVVLSYSGLWFLSRGKWLGAGDIRLVAIMGLFLSPGQLIVGLFVTYFVGSMYALYALKIKGKNRKSRIAFGPFLIIGFYFGLFFGNQIANWYIRLIGF